MKTNQMNSTPKQFANDSKNLILLQVISILSFQLNTTNNSSSTINGINIMKANTQACIEIFNILILSNIALIIPVTICIFHFVQK